MHSIYFMLDKYIKGAGELRIMKSIIEDTRAVSPVVATLLLIVVVASASSFIAVMVSDFGRDTAEVDIEDVGDAAAIKIDIIGTDLAKPATDALKSRYEEVNRGVRINVEGDDTDAGIIAVGMRLADIAAADRVLTLDELEKHPALEPYQIGNGAIVVISKDQHHFTKDGLREIYNCTNASGWRGFHYEGETGIEERFWEYLNLTADNISEIHNKNKNVTSSFELMLEVIKEEEKSVGFIPFGYVMTGDNRKYIAGIEDISAGNITLENITAAVREENETLAEEIYPKELRPPIYYVTNGKPSTLCDAFIKWVRSPEGQAILKGEGYVSLY
ncbi:MAG: hypothetical protein DRM98_00685 [Thermoplasmata archaeon]|nr:MAG: hypothetical protein DRM98_00685 [Thermoplasmata archaeon]